MFCANLNSIHFQVKLSSLPQLGIFNHFCKNTCFYKFVSSGNSKPFCKRSSIIKSFYSGQQVLMSRAKTFRNILQ
jgi:hypothetical protein